MRPISWAEEKVYETDVTSSIAVSSGEVRTASVAAKADKPVVVPDVKVNLSKRQAADNAITLSKQQVADTCSKQTAVSFSTMYAEELRAAGTQHNEQRDHSIIKSTSSSVLDAQSVPRVFVNELQSNDSMDEQKTLQARPDSNTVVDVNEQPPLGVLEQLVSGHSYLHNDSDFGVIERAGKKISEIFVPEQWCDVIGKCNKKKPFQVVRMRPGMFKSVDELAKSVTVRKFSDAGDKVEWLKMQWIQIRKSEPLKMFYTYSLQDDVDFSCVNLAKRGRFDNMSSRMCPRQPRPLSVEKVRDIQKLLKYVPPFYHDFYSLLEHNTAAIVAHLCDDELFGQSGIESEPTAEDDVLVSPIVDQTVMGKNLPATKKCSRSGLKHGSRKSQK
jgi:hypothetical protein